MTQGRYIIQNMIGRGGTSHVHEAYDILTRTHVAIKITPVTFSEYFYEEANTLSILKNHKNIVDLMGTFSLPTRSQELVLVLEKIDFDLQSYMINTPFCVNSAIQIFMSVCNAINYCHSNHIAHLDIKPENVLVSKDLSKIKLCDFAGSITWDSVTTLTTRANSSTPIYGAPETRTGRPFLADKADIWSLGILLHVLFTRKWPFPDTSYEHSLYAATKGKIMIQESFPKPLHHLLTCMLAMKPTQRPTISEIQQQFVHNINLTYNNIY